MKKRIINEQEAIDILRSHFKHKKDFDKVLAHSLAVQKVAVRIGKQVNADIEFLKIASILHDIGRSKCPPHMHSSINHNVVGAKILRNENLPKFANVAERHVFCGISKKDVETYKFNLPKKSFIPLTKEEKVLSYADNLLKSDKVMNLKYVFDRFSNLTNIVKRIIRVHNYLVKRGMKKKIIK